MFTGIIKGLGSVIAIEDRDAFRVLKIDVGHLVEHPKLGGSVSVSGVCLTIVDIEGTVLTFEVMGETLKLSTLADVHLNDVVNLETPLRLGDEFGGHIVQGHIDGTAQILETDTVGENTRVRLETSAALGRQIVHKGSVALDGVSLTVCDPIASPAKLAFDVWLLPFTLEHTTFGRKRVGERVNVEVDYLVKAILSKIEPRS